MKLLFKQRFFSWFDSYDIYDEAGNTMFVVKGEHCVAGFIVNIVAIKPREKALLK